jgi:hypothetical protein
MPQMLFNLETLKDIDLGKVSKAFDIAVRRCVQDCIDRPGDKNGRLATLKMKITPVLEQDESGARCEVVTGEFEVHDSVPKRRSKPYSFRVKAKTGGLSFSFDSPDEVDQTTIFDDEEIPEKDKKKKS